MCSLIMLYDDIWMNIQSGKWKLHGLYICCNGDIFIRRTKGILINNLKPLKSLKSHQTQGYLRIGRLRLHLEMFICSTKKQNHINNDKHTIYTASNYVTFWFTDNVSIYFYILNTMRASFVTPLLQAFYLNDWDVI